MRRLLLLMVLLALPLVSCEDLLGPEEDDKPSYHKLDFTVCVTADPRAVMPGQAIKLRAYAQEGKSIDCDWIVPGGTTELVFTEKGDIYTLWRTPTDLGTGIAEVKAAIYIPEKVADRNPSWVFTLYLGLGVAFDNMEMTGAKCSSGTVWDHM